MNIFLLLFALLALVVAVSAYPPGLTIFYESPTISLEVPERLVEQGYPRIIRIDSEFMYSRYGLDYGGFVRDSFREDGIYIDGRRLSPEDCGEVIGGSVKIAPLKAGLFLLSAATLMAAFMYSGAPGNRREVGGVI
ncbi:MAG: hypothetical protein QXP38_00200 [Nitrososphaerota archaeon]